MNSFSTTSNTLDNIQHNYLLFTKIYLNDKSTMTANSEMKFKCLSVLDMLSEGKGTQWFSDEGRSLTYCTSTRLLHYRKMLPPQLITEIMTYLF